MKYHSSCAIPCVALILYLSQPLASHSLSADKIPKEVAGMAPPEADGIARTWVQPPEPIPFNPDKHFNRDQKWPPGMQFIVCAFIIFAAGTYILWLMFWKLKKTETCDHSHTFVWDVPDGAHWDSRKATMGTQRLQILGCYTCGKVWCRNFRM